MTDGVRFRERGLCAAQAARYTILRRGTTAGRSAPLVGARSARQGSRRVGFGRCGASGRQRAEAVRRKRDLDCIGNSMRDQDAWSSGVWLPQSDRRKARRANGRELDAARARET